MDRDRRIFLQTCLALGAGFTAKLAEQSAREDGTLPSNETPLPVFGEPSLLMRPFRTAILAILSFAFVSEAITNPDAPLDDKEGEFMFKHYSSRREAIRHVALMAGFAFAGYGLTKNSIEASRHPESRRRFYLPRRMSPMQARPE